MSKSSISNFKTGDVVRVRSMEEIALTLDANGEADHVPFMPEMLPYCGKTFRVARVAHTVCVNSEVVQMKQLSDTVVLQMAHRCDGKHHGGCQMGCHFLWKTAWLERSTFEVDCDSSEAMEVKANGDKQVGAARHQGGEGRFHCQATALDRATELSAPWKIGPWAAECRDNDVTWGRVGAYLGRLVTRKLRRENASWVGTCRGRTPDLRLGLKLGDTVRVKSRAQILSTLDAKGCHRGLWFDGEEMARYCGQELIVSRCIERFIDETSGRMIELTVPTVVLSETHCSGVFRRFCSRGMLFFWREAWLERA